MTAGTPDQASPAGATTPDWLDFLPRRLGPGRRVHFVGVGGVGQNALARILLEAGVPVSGSDLNPSPTLDDLTRLGGVMHVGHAAPHAAGAGLVVVSSAVPAANPEIIQARAEGTPIVKRAELLGDLTAHRQAICVAGTHGKTTTSAMIALVLLAAGLDPTVMVGGTVPTLGTGGRYGRGPHLVAEADEFDASFLRFSPTAAIVTSIERDHLDFYRDLDAIIDAFRAFVARLPAEGLLVVCADDPLALALADRVQCPVRTYGLEAGEWRATAIARNDLGGNDFTVRVGNRDHGRFRLAVPGRHNVANALATVVGADWAGVDPAHVATALASFVGVRRRLELKGTAAGITVYDDYGHHPTEVRATLAAARERHAGRIVCLFQPHTVNRTRALFAEFAAAFGDADVALIADIYVPAGREAPATDVTSGHLVRAMRHPHAEHVGDLDAALARLRALAQPGDLVITMGAGDVYRVGEALLSALPPSGGA